MRRDIADALGDLARRQCGVVSRRQVLEAGMPRTSIESKVRCGQWQRVFPRVYALAPGALGRTARAWGAILWAGDGAVLSHETAAEILMITSTGSDMLHVSIPPDRRLLPVPGIAVHRAAHVVGLRFPAGQIPVTWAEDTVLDLTQTAQDFDDVCGWITAAFSRGKVSEGTMLAHMRERTRLKWREDLIHLIAEAASGTHSVLEYRYDRYVERAHGLPRARRQVRYVKPGGSRGYRDRCYEQYGVVVELDGKAYHPRENRWRETDRDNAAAADHGSSSLHYGWRHVRYEACQTARQVGKVLQNNGWPGTPTRCGSQCLIAES